LERNDRATKEVMDLHTEMRRQEIVKMLSLESPMQVEDIIGRLDATPATIRRDLTYLEKTGAIMRTRGAAKIVNPFPTRNIMFSSEKLLIAKYAASLVEDGSSIILDSGTTTLALANQLVNKKYLSVVTNSISIVNAFANTDISTTIVGGYVLHREQAVVGPDAEAYMKNIHASKLFLATTGIRIPEGLTCVSPFQASIKKAMIQSANKVILLADSSKFEASGMMQFADFKEIHCLITSKPLKDKELRKWLDNLGVEVVVVN
jgi:DeoR/GlpR family transcriptional regulator of sugar metabolism